jgi:hypothetical protein
MMSLATIREFQRQAAAKARRQHKLPFEVTEEDLQDWNQMIVSGHLPSLPFPNLGDFVSKGWTKEEDFFVDSTGWGSETEPALTIRALVMEKLEVGKAYAITECGEFQLYISSFIPPAVRKGKVAR